VSNSKLDPNEDDELHLVAMDSQQQRCSLIDDLPPQRIGSNASPLDSRSVASVSPVFDLHRPSTSGGKYFSLHIYNTNTYLVDLSFDPGLR